MAGESDLLCFFEAASSHRPRYSGCERIRDVAKSMRRKGGHFGGIVVACTVAFFERNRSPPLSHTNARLRWTVRYLLGIFVSGDRTPAGRQDLFDGSGFEEWIGGILENAVER